MPDPSLPVASFGSEDKSSLPTTKHFHDEPDICEYILERAITAVPLKIALSKVAAPGSGLFVTQDVSEGQELFRTKPPFACVPTWNVTTCHFCFKSTDVPFASSESSTAEVVGQNTQPLGRATPCSRCKSARFCSKECHVRAWNKFHKDECPILTKEPNMSSECRLLYRILFYRKRGRISAQMGKALSLLENHFTEFSDNLDSSIDVFHVVKEAIAASRTQLELRVVWSLFPALRVNAMEIPSAGTSEADMEMLDLLISVINHGCDPNAFCFLQDGQVRVRTLKPIRAGEEVTMCYSTTSISTNDRRKQLKTKYFFDCHCHRCTFEFDEISGLLNRDPVKISAFDSVISVAHEMMRKALCSPQEYNAEDLEEALRIRIREIFPSGTWPEHIEGIPQVHLSLATLYDGQDGHEAAAFRSSLKGALVNRHRSGPTWVNNLHAFSVLLANGNCTLALFAGNAMFPNPAELSHLVAGYWAELTKEAELVYGADSQFTADTRTLSSSILEVLSGPKLGTEESRAKFDKAQKKLLAWAGIDPYYGIGLE